jgi:hypothetical protein
MEYDAAIPLDVVTEDLFVALYRLGKTESDPEQACQLAFGSPVTGAVDRARQALRRGGD